MSHGLSWGHLCEFRLRNRGLNPPNLASPDSRCGSIYRRYRLSFYEGHAGNNWELLGNTIKIDAHSLEGEKGRYVAVCVLLKKTKFFRKRCGWDVHAKNLYTLKIHGFAMDADAWATRVETTQKIEGKDLNTGGVKEGQTQRLNGGDD